MKSSLNETSFAGSSLGPSEGHSSWSHSTFVIPFIIPNISFAVPSHATHALEKATLMNKQLPNPKHVDTLVELTYKRGSATWDAPKEDINKWLADELHHRLRRNQMAIAETAKGFLLMYELLIRGDECFVKAVARHPDFFSVEFMPVDVAVAGSARPISKMAPVVRFVLPMPTRRAAFTWPVGCCSTGLMSGSTRWLPSSSLCSWILFSRTVPSRQWSAIITWKQRSECSPSRPLQCVGCCSTTRPDCGS